MTQPGSGSGQAFNASIRVEEGDDRFELTVEKSPETTKLYYNGLAAGFEYLWERRDELLPEARVLIHWLRAAAEGREFDPAGEGVWKSAEDMAYLIMGRLVREHAEKEGPLRDTCLAIIAMADYEARRVTGESDD